MTITTLPLPRVTPSRGRPPAVLVFPGQGSQWPGMAAELLDASAVFRTHLRAAAAAVARYVGWDIEDVLRRRPGAPGLDRVDVVQPALWAVHISLAAMWIANGLVPQAVIGQSQGEIAAAYVAGALSLDDAARIITMRSKLFAETLVGRGGIASILLSAADVEPLLAPFGGLLEVAGDIGPVAATVAGAADSLETFVAHLHNRGVSATVVPASIPSHCYAIGPLRTRLLELLAPVRPQPSRLPMYSTVTGAAINWRALTADYWYANARQPVLLRPAVQNLLAHGARTFVESSAHPVLTSALRATAERAGLPVTVAATLRRGAGGPTQFAIALADAGLTATTSTSAA